MIIRWVLALSLMGLSVPVAAQAPANARAPVYLSLMGEPFHGDADASPVAKWIAQADTNGDGVIDRSEFQRDTERFFHRLDTNGDGIIDPDEMSNYENVIAPADVRMAGGMRSIAVRAHTVVGYADDEGGSSDSGPEVYGRSFGDSMPVPEPVAMADTDISRTVSLQEFKAAASKRFTQHDANSDGKLSADELGPKQAPDMGRHAKRSR